MSGAITQFDLQMPRDWLRKYCRHDRQLQACEDVCKTCGHRCGDHAHEGFAPVEPCQVKGCNCIHWNGPL